LRKAVRGHRTASSRDRERDCLARKPLIGDGATLQIGLGSLPNAILENLTDKKDLGVHSGTIGDRVADFVDAGVITNLRKPINTGRCVAGTLLGTERLYRWVQRVHSWRYAPALHA
jgi:acyl-CoA hydrolase